MQAHIFVMGFVQGVGFRRFIRSKARLLGLTGWVKNLSDGRVEALVQGPKASIEQLIKIIEKGNWLSGVKDVVVDFDENQEQFKEFIIIK
jgi:acylphosphatase